jgi:hypothetical protein
MSPRRHEAVIKDSPMSTTDDIYRMSWMTSISYYGPWNNRHIVPIVMLLEGVVELSSCNRGEAGRGAQKGDRGGPGGEHTEGDTMYMQGWGGRGEAYTEER